MRNRNNFRNNFIETMTQRIIDSVMDDDRVRNSICDGCIWQKYPHNDPNSGCTLFDEQCEHYAIVRDIEDAAREAAEIVVSAAM